MNEYDKFFWISVKNTKAIVAFWLVMAIVFYLIYVATLPTPQQVKDGEVDLLATYYEQLAIISRSLFLLTLFMYSTVRVLLPGLKFWSHIKRVLDDGDSSIHYGVVLRGLCSMLAAGIIAGAIALNKSF